MREVASAQLEPREIDWTLVLDNPDLERSKFIRSTLAARLTRAELKTLTDHGPPVSTWPRYAQRHRWRIRVEGIQVPLYMFLRTFNGERRFYDFARQPARGAGGGSQADRDHLAESQPAEVAVEDSLR